MFRFRTLWAALFAAVLAFSPTTARAAAPADIAAKADSRGEATRVYEQVLPATAWILSEKKENGKWVLMEATAWVVDAKGRLLVTNNHVVEDSRKMFIFFPAYKRGKLITDREWYAKNGKRIPVHTVVAEARKDLAVIQADEIPDGVTELPVAAESPEVGEAVFTVGNPHLEDDLFFGNRSTVRSVKRETMVTKQGGRFDGVRQETRFAISGGASGSPVVNAAGEVVGVVFAGEFTDEDEPATRAFSVDVSELRTVLTTAKQKLDAGDGGDEEKPRMKPREDGRTEGESHGKKPHPRTDD